MDLSNARARGHERIFFDILKGKQRISKYNAAQFLEAVYCRMDPVSCIEKIIASNNGLESLQQALWSKLDPQFFNERAAPLLDYLRAPDLKIINGGSYLDNIVMKIVNPPIFWDEFRKAFLHRKLDGRAQESLGWLLLQLCSLPVELSTPHRQHPDTTIILNTLMSLSSSLPLRTMGQKIKQVLDTCVSLKSVDSKLGAGPGGRHDNDFEDFRQISILPTSEEVSSTELSFLRPAYVLEDPTTEASRVAIHLDNQFRLLREDMLYEMREELQIVFGIKKGFHRGVKITDLYVKEIECGSEGKRTRWGLVLICNNDIPILKNDKTTKARKQYLLEHPKFMKHQSLACLVSGKEVIAFPTIYRDEDRLAKLRPEIVLQFEEEDSTQRALRKLKMENDVTLIQIDTAIFAYEPILKRLQQGNTLPLDSELLFWRKGMPVAEIPEQTMSLVRTLRADWNTDLQRLLDTPNSVKLDQSQAASLISGLTQQVSLVQGPPGTGKSFIGALLAKALFKYTEEKRILVVCYTNHALDDILEGLLNIGIPRDTMLRLGKSTGVTEALTMQHQPRGGNRNPDQWKIIDGLKDRSEKLYKLLQAAFDKYNGQRVSFGEIADHLEFEDPVVAEALRVPNFKDADGMTIVDHKGQPIRPFYLMARWRWNLDAGIFADQIQDPELQEVWKKPKKTREALWKGWEGDVLEADIKRFCKLAQDYNQVQQDLARAFNSSILPILRRKRILGCTTTAAAKYSEDIQAFNPDVLLVEEAGEILESHVLTAMAPETSQIILIGDHKQLRPKVNNYLLTVERGEGYDLNRSLFERLILKDYPHITLTKQHRMRPEISALIKDLTYPELIDADSTLNRPDVLGLQDNIVFIHHEHLEGDDDNITDKRDLSSTSSKHNKHEVEMVLKIVKYLGQQGYGTDDLVILTPYLGQLHKLQQALRMDNDPVLNDLDSYDLVRAGLVNQAEAILTKKRIRLATIDNYQGEESDIVIISLTRSNPKFEIGFMFSPERLNVLLSRSRNGLIMLGNMTTFQNARKGKELWTKLFNQLKNLKHIYEGLPVKCERHPDRSHVIQSPEEFDLTCPDGGCNAPCGIKLVCGIHLCPSKCHQLQDHSKMRCGEVIPSRCTNGHSQPYICGDGPLATCEKCEREVKAARKKQEQALAETRRREAEQRAHLQRMDAVEAEIAVAIQKREDARLANERADAIQQKQADLASILSSITGTAPDFSSRTTSAHPTHLPQQVQPPYSSQTPSAPLDGRDPDSPPVQSTSPITVETTVSAGRPSSTPPLPKPPSKPFPTLPVSPSKLEWHRQKTMFGITSQAVDAIMDMTGLEGVKERVLETMAKIETALRQNASLKKERFNAVFLGNPGTGKTTVARHYAQFLADKKVTPAAIYTETTGSKLAHEGVDGAKKLLDSVIQSGGGTIFIDEAYQLTSGNSSQGPAVLDFLLAEMENNIGTVVFLLAGYNKEMEKFFEHNPGLKSRVPVQLKFADYKDDELMDIFVGLLSKTFQGRMRVDDGTEGLYSRILIRRLGRQRGQPGFGNARDLQIAFERVRGRQAKRLAVARKNGQVADDFYMLGEDIIGPEPSKAIQASPSWKKLQSLIGLKSVKQSIKSLVSLIEENYKRELMEKEPMDISLNRVFLGSPGTGKTTVAKLYGQVLVDLGLLSNGEVLVKNPSDFVGAHLGQSESQTKAILANTVGKVLIIDEAYMLYGGGSGGSGGNSNQFKTSVIDTIVAEVQSVPGEDRCVLLLGYKDQMLEMFQNVNPGLSRRFKIEDAFTFEDFDDAELLAILDLKLYDQDLDATKAAKGVAIDLLARMRNRPNFGNAGEVENLVTSAKTRAVIRRGSIPLSKRPMDIIFESEDFDPDYNRGAAATINLTKLFEDIVGRDDVVTQLSGYLDIAKTCKTRELDIREHIPTNFVFTGPPGTGKTTIARKMGQVFYDMGMLAAAEVIECSASDLVGQFVGQTGPKTRKLFEKALGKVLFVDEAYRLSGGHFAQEAVDELVGLITHPNFKAKLIIILAGYEQDMNRLMSVNAGLSSRFPNQVYFYDMDAEHCLKVVRKELEKQNVMIPGLDDDVADLCIDMKEMIRDMSELKDWGNARDMITLSKALINRALLKSNNSNAPLQLSEDEVLDVLKTMLDDRIRRSSVPVKQRRRQPHLPVQTSLPEPPSPPSIDISTAAAEKKPDPPSSPPDTSRSSTPGSVASARGRGRGGARGGRGRGRGGPATPPARVSPAPASAVQTSATTPQRTRDPGVSDEIWQAMIAAERTQEEIARKAINSIRLWEQKEANERRQEQKQKKDVEDLAKAEAKERDAAKRAELQRQREEARRKEDAARVAREKAARELAAKREAERKRREQEAQAQRKLRQMGICPAGFQWLNMGSYYRCAGGSHTVPLSQLGL